MNLFDKDGAFAPMLKNAIERVLEAEMEDHLNESEVSALSLSKLPKIAKVISNQNR